MHKISDFEKNKKQSVMINNEDFLELYSIYIDNINNVNLKYKRYLYDNINWDARLICIRGAKGTGKTTMILQYIKEHFPDINKALYISLDDFHFQLYNIYDVAEYAYNHGVESLFIDEIHYHKNWEQLIKNIYDRFKKLKIVYTGSSILQIDKSTADLSRRQTVYDLAGFSLREYLYFNHIIDFQVCTLEDLLNNHIDISMSICKQIKPLLLFDNYLKNGYYPFSLETKQDYLKQLLNVINTIIFQDIPLVDDISFSTLQKARKLLMILAKQVPLEPNISMLCREIETTREVVIKLLFLLQKANLIMLLNKEINSYKSISKPDKIYIDNTNLMYAITTNVNKGTLRETFFLNQLSVKHQLLYPKKGDFLIDDKFTVEVGGNGKTFKQIKDLPNSLLAVDDIEHGLKNTIPLYLFGFLY